VIECDDFSREKQIGFEEFCWSKLKSNLNKEE
jgi:hypothetical protein